jgi:hypothetical protein
MPDIVKQRLSGSVRRLVNLRSTDSVKEIVITIAEGETLPDGTLEAVAVSGDDEIVLDVSEEIGSGSGDQDQVVVQLDPYDFDAYGGGINWAVEVTITDEADESAETWTAYVLFSGTVLFVEDQTPVIESTVIQEVGSS